MLKKLLLLVTVFAVFIAPSLVVAQGLKDANKLLAPAAREAGVEDRGDIASTVGLVINTALSLVGLIFLCFMVYAGYLWLTARGESEQIEKAKEIIKSTIIGLVIVMSAYSITVLITRMLERTQ